MPFKAGHAAEEYEYFLGTLDVYRFSFDSTVALELINEYLYFPFLLHLSVKTGWIALKKKPR